MTATAFYRLARIAGGFKLSLSVHITKMPILDGHLCCSLRMVGTMGFEPTTFWSRTRRTTKLCYVPRRQGMYPSARYYATLERKIKEGHLVRFIETFSSPNIVQCSQSGTP